MLGRGQLLFALPSIRTTVAKRCFSVNTALAQSIRDDADRMFEPDKQRGGGRFQVGGPGDRDSHDRRSRMEHHSSLETGATSGRFSRSYELPVEVVDKAMNCINSAQALKELMKFRGVTAVFAKDILRERQRSNFTSFIDFCDRVNYNMSFIKNAFYSIANDQLSFYGRRTSGFEVDPVTTKTMFSPVPRASFFQTFTGRICSYHVSRFQMRYAIIDITRDGENVTAKLIALDHANLNRDQQREGNAESGYSVEEGQSV